MNQVPQKNNKAVADFLASISFDPSLWFISIAVNQNMSSGDLLRIIRSQLPAKLEEHELHTKLKHQLRKMIKYIHNFTRQAQEEAKKAGNDVFLSFAFREDVLGGAARDNTAELLQQRSFPVGKVIETQLTVAHIPDLTYVYQSGKNVLKEDTITVTIDPEQLICYSGKEVSLEKVIWKEKNIFSKPEDDEYIEVVNMSTQNKAIHSTGSEKVERTFQSGLLLFVKNELERIEKQLNPQVVYLYFSQSYEPLRKKIDALIEKSIASKKIHLEYISSDQFRHVDANLIKPSFGMIKELSKIKNNKSATSNLHEICKLIRQGNLDTLYLSSELNQSGYITPSANCYTYPVKDSKKVDSIRPWLIKSALNISAKLIILNTQDIGSEVLAIPRY